MSFFASTFSQPQDNRNAQYGTVNQTAIPGTYSASFDEARKFALYDQQVQLGLANVVLNPPVGGVVTLNAQATAAAALQAAQVANPNLFALNPVNDVDGFGVAAQPITEVNSTKNVTSNILRSIKNPGAGAQKKAATREEVLTDTTQPLLINNIPNLQSNLFGQLPPLFETSPGVFAGQAINTILQPTDLSIGVNAYGDIFGGPVSSVILRRIDELNGFGLSINNNNYQTGGLNQGAGQGAVPFGAYGKPFLKDNFFVSYAPGNSQVTSARIFQFQKLPLYSYTGSPNPMLGPAFKIAYTGPNDNVYVTENSLDKGTQGLSLAINAQTDRTIYLLRRQQPYYFTMGLSAQNPNINYQGSVYDYQALDLYGGFYFTNDPVGGSEYNFINQIGPVDNFVPIQPRPANQSVILRPGGSITTFIDNTWFDHLYYQSLSGPFQGGKVWIIGRV